MAKRVKINSDITVGMDQPSRDDLQSLAKAGFNSVVDLRLNHEGSNGLAPGEEGVEAERAGLRYVNIKVDGDCVEPAQIDTFRHQIAELRKPIFVHCSSGKRSGSFALVEAAIREGLAGEEMLRRADSLGVAHGSEEIREIYRRYVDVHLRHPPRESGGTLPPTTRRVEKHSPEEHNRKVVAEIERSVRACAGHPNQINARLVELDREWDMERTLEANAATIALIGTLLGAFANSWFLIIPAVVTAFLLQHALQGWCPPVPFFRKRGVRTADEISQERMALKVLRGDFQWSGAGGEPTGQADRALSAVRG